MSILGKTTGITFVIKKTPRGYHHFVKVAGAWKSIPGMEFHQHLPNGTAAEVRIFTHDPVRSSWTERRESLVLWNPETN